MTVGELSERLGFQNHALPAPEREAKCGYAGDLLSHVLARVPESAVWVTVMQNTHTLAVAKLREVAAVVLADCQTPPSELIAKAEEEKINLLSAGQDAFTVCKKIAALMERNGYSG